MVEVLTGAVELLKNKSNFYDYLSQGKIPSEYDCTSGRMTILGENIDGQGNSRATFLKAAVILSLIYFSKKSKVQHLNGDNGAWMLKNSAILQVYSLPEGRKSQNPAGKITEEEAKEFSESAFHMSDGKMRHGATVVHSGFSFGGQNTNMVPDAYNPSENPLAPRDCTAGLSWAAEDDSTLTTLDYLYNTRLELRGFASKDPKKDPAVIKKWETSKERAALKKCTLLTIYNPEKGYITDPSKIREGDRVIVRTCPDTDPDMVSDDGTGHARLSASKVQTSSSSNAVVEAVVASKVQADGQFLYLDWGRNMPKVEGGAGMSKDRIVNRKGQLLQVYRKS